MHNYTVAFDDDLVGLFSKAEMKLIANVTIMHKKSNPEIAYVIWEERDITAFYFDDREAILITTEEKGKLIISGQIEYDADMLESLVEHG